MSTIVGNLRVILGLDSGEFDAGRRRAGAGLDAMRKQFLAVTAVATALGAGLSAITMKVSGVSAELRRFSQVADTTPEQFQKWAAATATVGVQSEKLADILKDTKDRVGDFLTTGGGPMADFFEQIAPKIGVTAEQFRDLSGADALQLYVSSLEKANLSQAEMTFFMEAMASDSTLLLPLLKDNGAAILALGENARSLGGLLEDDTIEALRTMRVEVGNVGTAMAGIGYRIANEVAPALEALAAGFANAMREGEPLRRAIDFMIENIGRLTTWLGVAVTAFGVRYVGALVLARVATLSLSASLVLLRAALIRTGILAVVVIAGELVFQFGLLVTAAGGFGNAMSLLGDVVREVWQRMIVGGEYLAAQLRIVALEIQSTFLLRFAQIAEGFSTLMLGMGESVSAFARELQGSVVGLNAEQSAIQTVANRLATAFNAPLESMAALRAAMRGTAEDTDGAAAAASRVADKLEKVGGAGGTGAADTAADAVRDFGDAVELTSDDFRGLEQAGESAFTGLITGATTAKDAMRNLLNQFASMAASSAFRQIFELGAGAIAGSAFGSLFRAPLAPGSSPIPAPRPFAMGTNFAPGGLSLVGEQGPELVNLPRGAQVIPNHKLGGGGGGFTFAPVIDARGADPASAGRMAEALESVKRDALSMFEAGARTAGSGIDRALTAGGRRRGSYA